MTATREERRYFWERLGRILKEKNSPFTLKVRTERGGYRHDAIARVGKTNFFIGVYIDKGLMRVGAHLNDLQYCSIIAYGGMGKARILRGVRFWWAERKRRSKKAYA